MITNAIMDAAFNALIGALPRTVIAPDPPLGYGTDISCTNDTDAFFSEVNPDSVIAIGQALFRRLITMRGTLADDSDYGMRHPVQTLVNRPVTEIELYHQCDEISLECAKDERVSGVNTSAVYTAITKTIVFTVAVTARDVNLDTFSFVFSVADAGAILDRIGSKAGG